MIGQPCMLKSGLLLSGGNIAVALLGLVRNIVVARLISVEDFGIASTFAITMALVEMTSSLALDQLLVQAKDGERPVLQNTAHGIQAVRGIAGAVLLFLVAGPLAALFGVPQIAWAYQLMAAVPLLRGLAHLDMIRMQREMRFVPSIGVNIAALGLSTIVAVPLALWLYDFRALLYVIVLQQLVFTVASHIVAVRPYRWAWDGVIVRRAISFGWPLLLNGFLMFGVFQGDRIIVGSLIGMTELGWFSAAFALTLTPTLVAAKTLQSFFLPLLSQAQDDPDLFYRHAIVAIEVGLLAGVGLVVFFAIVGPVLMTGLYGENYKPAASILILLAVMQGVRMSRLGISVVAISKAKTRIPPIANTLRILALPIAWVAVRNGFGINTVIGLAIAGEIAAFAVSMILLRKWLSLNVTALSTSVFACAVTFIWIGVDSLLFTAGSGNFRFEKVFLVVMLPVVLLSMPALRIWLKSLFQVR